MKTPHIIAAALAAFMSITPIVSAEAFLRPTVYLVSPTEDGYDDEVGYGLQGGSYFGAKNEHELSFEVMRASWEFTEEVFIFPDIYTGTSEETLMPVLLNYRYHFKPAAGPVSFYIGPSLGLTRYELDLRIVGPGVDWSGSDSEWVFTMSGTLGMLVALGENVELDVGYRFLQVDDAEFTINGLTFEVEKSKAHIFYAGLGFKF